MSGLQIKKTVVYATLALLTAWPLAHVCLVEAYQLSPWKLFGWGMYAEPRFGTVGMEVYYREHGSERFRQLTAPGSVVREEATMFLERHRWLRRLAPPDGFARTIFALHPEIEELEIVIFRPVLERDTGMAVMSTREYSYKR